MAQPPDVGDLESWEDAFQYPLPIVRKVERQLRKNIDDNRHKLRSLVGTSYRDLLGTAERIIEMDEQMQHAEIHMSEIGRRCNARQIERIGANHKKLRIIRPGAHEQKRAVIAQTKVLQSAIAFCGRCVKRRGDALVAAKVLVLARLLHKCLAEIEESPAVVEELRKRLGVTRKRLLSYISRTLGRSDLEKTEIVSTLCAYSLISSASSQDALRYFLQVRFKQLESSAEGFSEASLLDMLGLYSQTLLDARQVFPRKLADALSQLSKMSIFRDESVSSIYELNLDVYDQWIPDDVRNFHPWVRQDQLTSTDVGDALASWNRQAQECLMKAMVDMLSGQEDAIAILQIRQKVLTLYLTLSAKLRNEDHSQTINKLRSLFLDRLAELVRKAVSLPQLSFDAQQHDTPNLWSMASEDSDFSNGAIEFRQTVIRRQHGRDSSIERVTEVLDAWMQRLNRYAEVVTSMRATRWDVDLEFDLDDQSDGESLHGMLSKSDPQLLEAKVKQQTAWALEATYRYVERSFGAADTSPRTALRVLRELDQRRRDIGSHLETAEKMQASAAFVASLHRRVAMNIRDDPIKQFARSVSTRSYALKTLWDGTPPLPVQPSPSAYYLLKSIHRAMSEAGNDLWSPDAVQAVKSHLCNELGSELNIEMVTKGRETSLSNGHAANGDHDGAKESVVGGEDSEGLSKETVNEGLLQLLFDMLYLKRALAITGLPSNENMLDTAVEEIKGRADIDASANECLTKSANEYWKRTYLFFGLLAVGHSSS